MPVNVVCPQCGMENKTVGVFCVRCGARMGAPTVHQKREAFPIGRYLAGAARLVGILVLAVVVGLAFWPLSVAETTVDEAKARKVAQWVGAMELLIRQQGTTASLLADEDINIYHAWRLQEAVNAGRAQGAQMSLDRIRVEIRGDRVRAVAVGGWGPFRLSFDVRGLPETAAGPFHLAIREARLGHLKLPRPAHGWVAGKFEQILAGMTRERDVLNHVRRVDLTDGKARLVVAP